MGKENKFKFKDIMKRILLLTIILVLSSTKLSIHSPSSLKEEFEEKFGKEDFDEHGVNYTIANFGHIPYGKTVSGPLIFEVPYNACEPIKEVSTITDDPPIMLITRGNCTFVTKVKNAQNAGAKMVIIEDNRVEKSYLITMADDGAGDIIRIPSIFIDEVEGDILKTAITSLGSESPYITIKFDLNKVDIAHYYFFLNMPNKEAFVMIREFDKYREQIQEYAIFQPIYEFYSCWYCGQLGYVNDEIDCLGGGRYCAIDPDGDGIATGRDVVEEQLRQLCIYEHYHAKWWKYLENLDLHCPRPQSYSVCGEKKMADTGIDVGLVNECVKNSFNQSSADSRELQQIPILDAQLKLYLYSGVLTWPALVVNNVTYKGSIDAPDIMEIICNSLNVVPKGCRNYAKWINPDKGKKVQNDEIEIDKPNTSFIITVVSVILILFSLFMIFVYRKMVRREMATQMSSTVGQMVNDYIAMSEKSKDDM